MELTLTYIWSLFVIGVLCIDNSIGLRTSDICVANGKDIECGPEEQVDILQVHCGIGAHACAPFINRTIYDSCHGQSYCGDLNLRNMVNVYCDNQIESARRVQVNFRCMKGFIPACRVNVCPNNSPGLTCPTGGLIHVKHISCRDGGSSCSWETYVTLYTLCEARSDCSAMTLKSLLPSYCNHADNSQRNVLVDYVCLPGSSVDKKCPSTVRKLKEPFGLILSPGFLDHGALRSRHCYWSIEPPAAMKVKVMVHLAYHKDSMPHCGKRFLRIQFRDCFTGRIEKGTFCDIRRGNQEILSCGAVYINSIFPTVDSDFSDKFLISYQVSNSSLERTYGATAVEPCGIPRYQTSTIGVHMGINPHLRPGNTVSDYTSDSSVKDQDKNSGGPFSILKRMKMVFLYIFFGVIIVALLISLIIVIISYKKMDKKSGYRMDKSEKAALWSKHNPSCRNGDTPMETFRRNSVAETSVSAQTEIVDVPMNHYDVLVPTQNTDSTCIATIHLNSDNDKRLSAGSGFSSFRPSNRNSDLSSANAYGSYSSLNSNNSPQYYGRGHVTNNPQYHGQISTNGYSPSKTSSLKRGKKSPSKGTETQPLFRHASSTGTSDVEHYTVNEDDYAIVRKPPRVPNSRAKNYSLLDDLEPTYDNIYDSDVDRFRPTSGPYDKNRSSNSEMNFHFNPPYHHIDDV